MSPLRTLLSLSPPDRRLLARALATNALARVALHLMSIDRLRRWASRPGGGRGDVARIVWAGRIAARRTPFATCLSSALALQRMLAANGHASELHIGVAQEALNLYRSATLQHIIEGIEPLTPFDGVQLGGILGGNVSHWNSKLLGLVGSPTHSLWANPLF